MAEEEKRQRQQARMQAAAEEEKRQQRQAREQAAAEEEKRRQLQKEAEQRERQLEELRQQRQAAAARQLQEEQEMERQVVGQLFCRLLAALSCMSRCLELVFGSLLNIDMKLRSRKRILLRSTKQSLPWTWVLFHVCQSQLACSLLSCFTTQAKHGHALQSVTSVPDYRQAKARQDEEERQQQLLAEAQAAHELKIRRELERQARLKEEEQQQQQLLEEARARREYQRQQQLQEQAAAQQEQLRQQQAADLKCKRQHDHAVRQQQEEAAAAHAQAKHAALAAEADAWSQEAEGGCQSDVVADRQAEQGSASQPPSEHGHKERNWKSADHWLPPRGAPQVTVVGDQPRGWPHGAAFPALPPPNIFRGQG